MSTLADYLADTRRLLRAKGSSTVVYDDADLTPFINRAKNQRDLVARLIRVRISYALTANQFAYPLATVAANGAVLTKPTNLTTINPIDVLSLIVNTTVGNATTVGIRYPLGRWPYSKVAYLLSTSYPTYPVKFASMGPGSAGTIFLAPPPVNNYPAEWDLFCYSPDLALTTDADVCPYPYTDPIPFFAAAFAKMMAQRMDEAKSLLDLGNQRLAMAVNGARPLTLANPLADLPRR